MKISSATPRSGLTFRQYFRSGNPGKAAAAAYGRIIKSTSTLGAEAGEMNPSGGAGLFCFAGPVAVAQGMLDPASGLRAQNAILDDELMPGSVSGFIRTQKMTGKPFDMAGLIDRIGYLLVNFDTIDMPDDISEINVSCWKKAIGPRFNNALKDDSLNPLEKVFALNFIRSMMGGDFGPWTDYLGGLPVKTALSYIFFSGLEQQKVEDLLKYYCL